VRIHVDQARCEGHGVCQAAAPEVFDLDDDGVVLVRLDPVPAELEALARSAVNQCPVAAMTELLK
jgi:ferredoxin